MQSIHKTFWVKRTVFLCAFLLFSFSTSSFAASPLFTIEGVKVDITAKSAVAAREQAFEKAQMDAFKTLAERMLSEGEAANFQTPDISTISALIQDFEIANEQLSRVRYKADYTFRFKDNAVKNFFSDSNTSFTDVSAKPSVILPFMQRGDQTMLWSPFNAWMKAWNRTNDLQGLVPLIVPLGDLSDVRDIGDDEALNYQDSKLDRMLARYEAAEAIIMVATPDEQLSRVENESDAAVGKLDVYIYRTDRGRPEFVQSIEARASSSDTLGSVMDKAVVQAKRALRQDWKSKTTVKPSQSNRVSVRIQYDSLKEWADTQRALKRVYGINTVEIKSVTPKQAKLDLTFDGDERRLALALEQANMELSAPRTSNGSNDAMSYYAQNNQVTAAVIYDLKFKRYR